MGSSERLHAALAAMPPTCGAVLREDSLEQCSLPPGHERHGRAKPRTTPEQFAAILKGRIERAAVAFEQPGQREMVAGIRYVLGIVDAVLSDYDVSEPACGSPEKAYFILDWLHDPFAIPAARAYADACEATLPHLAADLRSHARDAELRHLSRDPSEPE